MKYICLGYMEPGTFEGIAEDKRHAVLDECCEHNDPKCLLENSLKLYGRATHPRDPSTSAHPGFPARRSGRETFSAKLRCYWIAGPIFAIASPNKLRYYFA